MRAEKSRQERPACVGDDTYHLNIKQVCVVDMILETLKGSKAAYGMYKYVSVEIFIFVIFGFLTNTSICSPLCRQGSGVDV